MKSWFVLLFECDLIISVTSSSKVGLELGPFLGLLLFLLEYSASSTAFNVITFDISLLAWYYLQTAIEITMMKQIITDTATAIIVVKN